MKKTLRSGKPGDVVELIVDQMKWVTCGLAYSVGFTAIFPVPRRSCLLYTWFCGKGQNDLEPYIANLKFSLIWSLFDLLCILDRFLFTLGSNDFDRLRILSLS